MTLCDRSPPVQVPGGTHLGRIDIGFWEHAAAKQHRNLVGIDLIVFGFATMDGFHGEGVAQDKGQAVVSAQVSEPIPGEDACDRIKGVEATRYRARLTPSVRRQSSKGTMIML